MSMNIQFVLLTILASTSGLPIFDDDVYTDKVCPGDIKNLWLDVMVIVDKSQLMTNAQLWQVRNTITSIFGQVNRIGNAKYPDDRRSTCVGIVTYDDKAVVSAELDAATSFTDLYNSVQSSLVSVDTTSTSILSQALTTAEAAFKAGRLRTYRWNFRQVIIVFAADYQGAGTALDAMPVAINLKNEGFVIITVSCTKDTAARASIAALASDNFSFVDEMNTAKLVTQITNALLSANCFCRDDFVQFRSDTTQYAVCISGYKATGGSYGYEHAVEYCQGEEKNAHLANEFSVEKHNFMQSYMASKFPKFAPEYYIGLRYLNNQWKWEQPEGQPRLPLSPTGYTNWAPGFPQANSTDQVVANQQWNNSTELVWAPPQSFDWLFVCQVEASSTEHYTDFSYYG